MSPISDINIRSLIMLMKEEQGIKELNNQPLEEVIDKLGEDLIISILENGKVEPDINPETETVQIEYEGMNNIDTDNSSIKYKQREGLSKLRIPFDLLHDVPFMVGKQTGEKRITDKEPSISAYAAGGSLITSGAFALNYLSEEYADVGVEISERATIATIFGGIMSAGFFEGRYEAIYEGIWEEKLDELTSKAGDYEVEFY